MAPSSNYSDVLARIDVTLSYLKDAVDKLEADAKVHRAHVYEALEGIRLNASHVDRSITEMQSKQSASENTLKEVEKWKQRTIGGWIMFVGIVSTISAAVTLFIKNIVASIWGS